MSPLGEVDLGWVGSRVFDTLGVKSFQALTAPMLIDSYALENAVIESGVTEEMMDGARRARSASGSRVLADGLRRPIGVKAPILGPADWRGISFGTLKSDGPGRGDPGARGDPVEIFGPHRREALDDGTLQGFEFGTLAVQRPPVVISRSLRGRQRASLAADGCSAREPGTSRAS